MQEKLRQIMWRLIKSRFKDLKKGTFLYNLLSDGELFKVHKEISKRSYWGNTVLIFEHRSVTLKREEVWELDHFLQVHITPLEN